MGGGAEVHWSASAFAADPPSTPSPHPTPPHCRVYWALGDAYRVQREHAHAQFLEAATIEGVEGPWVAPAFMWLGHWYAQVTQDTARARKCYQRALALDAQQAGACVLGVGVRVQGLGMFWGGLRESKSHNAVLKC